MEFKRNDFLEALASKQRVLGQTQRLYKKLLETKVITRTEKIRNSNVVKTINRLNEERNDLRAQLWVADGVCHTRVAQEHLEHIQCMVDCQEHLAEEIHQLRAGLINSEQEIGRTNREVMQLNKQTVPENQHQAHVARARKRLSMLFAQLEVSVGRECAKARENGMLREKILTEISQRGLFNQSYGKMVQRLTSDRKYLLELIEYSFGIFENGINAYEKLDNRAKKDLLEKEQRKRAAQTIMRVAQTEEENNRFVDCKCKVRELADLQPKEYRRREKFRKEHVKKIELYKKVLEKIKAYTVSADIAGVIDKFKEQESIYYSYFTYANELSYHITLLDISVGRLYTEVKQLRQENGHTLAEQYATIDNLKDICTDKQSKNAQLKKQKETNDQVIENMLEAIQDIFEMTKSDFTPVLELLGDQTHVNLMNARAVLKVLEKRLNDIIAAVFLKERDDENISLSHYCLQDIEKLVEPPTPINDIVLTQQCPECGEGDAHQDDAGALIVRTTDETRKRLYEKIAQPEMQYRLHTISQCRLPQSRRLVAKRNL